MGRFYSMSEIWEQYCNKLPTGKDESNYIDKMVACFQPLLSRLSLSVIAFHYYNVKTKVFSL